MADDGYNIYMRSTNIVAYRAISTRRLQYLNVIFFFIDIFYGHFHWHAAILV